MERNTATLSTERTIKAIEPPVSKTGQNRCQRCFCRKTFETLKQQQDSSPCQAKCSPTKCFPLPLEPIKNINSFVRHPGCGRSSETIGASPLEAEFRHTRIHSNSSSMRLHAKQNAARQNASPYLWNYRTHTIGAQGRKSLQEKLQRCRRNALKAIESPASKTVENRCKRSFCPTPSKHSNTNKIHAQTMRNSNQKNCQNVACGTHKKL